MMEKRNREQKRAPRWFSSVPNRREPPPHHSLAPSAPRRRLRVQPKRGCSFLTLHPIRQSQRCRTPSRNTEATYWPSGHGSARKGHCPKFSRYINRRETTEEMQEYSAVQKLQIIPGT